MRKWRTARRPLLSVMGMGVFSYYQGRSHDYCFPAVIWPGVLLLAMNADAALHRWRQGLSGISVQTAKLRLFGCVCVLALFAAATTSDVLDGNMRDTMTITSQEPNAEMLEIMDSAAYAGVDIASEQCDILSEFTSDFLYTNLKMDYSMPVSAPVDWMLKSQADSVLQYLGQSTHPLMITQSIYDRLSNVEGEKFSAVLENHFTLLYKSDLYRVYRPIGG